MPGIRRFCITDKVDGAGAWRFKRSRDHWPLANRLYHHIYELKGKPLEDGDELIKCTLQEFQAGYDYALGIDVLLTFRTGQTLTVQEKFLLTKWNTLTVEFMDDWRKGVPGDWFTMKAQRYLCAYNNGYGEWHTQLRFNDWMLADWPRLQEMEEHIPWKLKHNTRDFAKSNFKYVPFALVPDECVILQKGQLELAQTRPLQMAMPGL